MDGRAKRGGNLIDHETFLKIPENERVFFVQLGWLCNDFMMFNRPLIAIGNNEAPTEPFERGNSSLILSACRLFAGRLCEGWEMLQTSFFRNQVSKDYSPTREQSGIIEEKHQILFSVS